jgi:hypothetical protein
MFLHVSLKKVLPKKNYTWFDCPGNVFPVFLQKLWNLSQVQTLVIVWFQNPVPLIQSSLYCQESMIEKSSNK